MSDRSNQTFPEMLSLKRQLENHSANSGPSKRLQPISLATNELCANPGRMFLIDHPSVPRDVDESTQTSENLMDIFGILYSHGFPELAEQIFLNLPVKTIRICKKVCTSWKTMVETFLSSQNSRLKRCLDAKLEEEWLTGQPEVSSVELPYRFGDNGLEITDMFSVGNVICQKTFHIVTDGDIVATSGVFSEHENELGRPLIHVMDAETFKLVKVIDVEASLPEKITSFVYCCSLYMENDKLYCTLTFGLKSRGKRTYLIFWNKNQDWVQAGLELRQSMPVDLFLSNVSHLPISWSTDKEPVGLIVTRHDDGTLETWMKVDPDQHFKFLVNNGRGFMIKCDKNGVKSWHLHFSKRPPVLLDISSEYLALSWYTFTSTKRIVDYYDVATGQFLGRLKLKGDFLSIENGRLNGNHLAICGVSVDRDETVIVYDLKSGKKMYESSSLTEPHNCGIEDFVILKEKIIFYKKISWPRHLAIGKLYFANFWV